MIISDLKKVKLASQKFKLTNLKKRNQIIKDIGKIIFINKEKIIAENKKDLALIDESNYIYDRLVLNDKRIDSIIKSCNEITKISDPLNKYKIKKIWITKDNLKIKKVAVPLGVVACIYEARPNVTVDITILSIKSGNATILRGGQQASNTNKFLVKLMKKVLKDNGIDENLIYNFPHNRENMKYLYNAIGNVDVIIPRGGRKLIDSVRENSKIPIIETGAGVVHLYIDDEIAKNNYYRCVDVIFNAKVSRPSVCNSLDSLIINKNIDSSFYKLLFDKLLTGNVSIGVLKKDYKKVEKFYPKEMINIIKKQNYYDELLSLKLNLVFVNNVYEAISHISKYSSAHSDGILSDNKKKVEKFLNEIDSAVVYSNTSTRFSDGECFGFGGEIGISTQKLHARGPMGTEALVSYKYIVKSEWKTR